MTNILNFIKKACGNMFTIRNLTFNGEVIMYGKKILDIVKKEL